LKGVIMTVREWLIEQFGTKALRIVGIDDAQLGGKEVADVTDVTLLIDDEGRTTYVGGVGVPLVEFGGVRLIFDDQAEKQWEAKLAAGGKKSIGPRPEARLRLVRSR
jgi:hypothetical protein